MSVRFECPRCQNVFVGGDDDAFADCPSCGALAVPAGKVTAEVPSRALSHSDEVTAEGRTARDPSLDDRTALEAPASGPGQGVFSALLADDIEQALRDPEGAAAAPAPQVFADPTAPISRADMRALVERSLSGEGEATDEAPSATLPPSLLLTRDDDDEGSAWSSELDDDLDDDLGDGASRAPAAGLPPELSLEPVPERPRPAPVERTEVGAFRDGVWDQNFTSQEVAPSAVLLSHLEAQVEGMQLFDGDALGEEAFGALDRAFDEVALRPDPAPLPSRAEDALRAMSADAAMSGFSLPMRPEDVAASVPAPPPLRRRKEPHLHLTLSEEAKALAGIPLRRRGESTEVTSRLPRARGIEPAPTRPPMERSRAPRSEATDPVQRPARPQGSRAEALPEVPSVWSGFTLGRVAAAVVGALVVGGLLGVAIAPEPERRAPTPRARAEQRFADGNRAYQEGRYDDALGFYRGSIALDRTFAPAYRAKAAALAKEKRYEEAAVAYQAYLDVAPGAVDATAVEEVLARYEGGSQR